MNSCWSHSGVCRCAFLTLANLRSSSSESFGRAGTLLHSLRYWIAKVLSMVHSVSSSPTVALGAWRLATPYWVPHWGEASASTDLAALLEERSASLRMRAARAEREY